MKQKIAIFIESDFYEKEIFYYGFRFQEAGIEPHFVSRLWGQPSLTFTGHEQHYPFECTESFEDWADEELRGFAALIVPSGYVSDRLRWTEDVNSVPPASDLLRRAFREPAIVKGIICHGLWLAAPVVEVVAGRRMTCHNNLVGDARAYGVDYVDEDVVEDGDLISARTGNHCHLLTDAIIRRLRG
jgi:protease I